MLIYIYLCFFLLFVKETLELGKPALTQHIPPVGLVDLGGIMEVSVHEDEKFLLSAK